MKNIIIKLLIYITGTKFSQRLLSHNMRLSQFFMGIGSGGDRRTSGEQVAFDLLKRNVEQPLTIFDIGSNQGQYLSLVENNFQNFDFQIYCFEPNSVAFERLENRFGEEPHIFLNNIAISDHIGKSALWYDKSGSELASLAKRDLEHRNITFTNSEEVQTDTIDHFCFTKNVGRINLLKLDIEGFEFKALSGAKKMFEQNAIDIVSFEFGASNIDTRIFFKDFWNFFNSLKMKIYRISPSGLLVEIRQYHEIHEQFRPTNFLAISRFI
jgi:FkbM family methyltransferase